MSGISITLRQLWSGKRALLLLILLSVLPGMFLLWLATQREGALPSTEAGSKSAPAKVEPIEGSDLKRVVLTEKAAERLGIQTAMVREGQAARKRVAGGEIVASPEAKGSGLSKFWVRVPLTESDLSKVDRGQPAHIFSFDLDDAEDSDGEEAGLTAEADEAPDLDDAEDDGEEATLYYAIDRADYGLSPGQRVRVELALLDSGTQRKLIPYAAVIYDVDGGTWVYVKEPNALAFVRQPIIIDYIEGDLVFLTEGPPAGVEVVTVGGAELYGAETGVSK